MSLFLQRLSRREVTYTFPARFETICIDLTPPPRGGGIIPIIAYRGSSAERGTLLRLQVCKRLGISLVELYDRVGKTVILIC